MVGNVWEWTRSKYKAYPYQNDERETIDQSKDVRVLRGGSFYFSRGFARCTLRFDLHPGYRDHYIGFRVGVVRSAAGSRTLRSVSDP